jgi:acyl-phosphate glycerol 3-phosphate acyltransferase
MLELLLAGIWGYLVGAVPTGVIVSRSLRGVDVRRRGSGHTGGANVARVAGAWGGLLTAAGDIILGSVAVIGPMLVMKDPWAATVAGVMAVVGHDWSVFILFGGGIGLAKLAGAMLAADMLRTFPTGIAVILLWLFLTRLLHFHRARSTILVMTLVGPLLWALGASLSAILLGALGGLVVIIKTIPDWYRRYE